MLRPLAALALLLAGTALPMPGRDLKALYLERCAACHGPDGSGRGPGGVRLGGRNLTEARWRATQPLDGLVASILRGKGAMPGFRRQLTEAEARRLLTEVLPLRGVRRLRGPEAPAAPAPALTPDGGGAPR